MSEKSILEHTLEAAIEELTLARTDVSGDPLLAITRIDLARKMLNLLLPTPDLHSVRA